MTGADRPRPICPMCNEPGIHPTVEACLDTLRATIDQLKTARAHAAGGPSLTYLGYYYPGFWP